MGKQAKSKALEEHRRQIALYLEAVRLVTGWKNTEMGKQAGGIHWTTIGRARRGESTLDYTTLLTLEAASAVTIPDELRNSAIAAKRPANAPSSSAEELRRIRADFEKQPPEVQRELLAELQRSASKAR